MKIYLEFFVRSVRFSDSSWTNLIKPIMDQQLHPPLQITSHHAIPISPENAMQELEKFLQRPSHGDEGIDPTVRVQLAKLRDALEANRYLLQSIFFTMFMCVFF